MTACTLHRYILAFLFFSFTSSLTWCQTSDDEPSTPRWLGVSFEQRSRVEKLTQPFRIDELGVTRTVAFRTRLQIQIRELIDPVRFYVEVQDSRSEWNDGQFVVPARHVDKLDFLQLQIQLVSNRFLGRDLPTTLQIGRFTMDLGKRRLSARNRMRNTTNALDGVHWQLGKDDNWVLHTFVSRLVLIDPEKMDTSDNRRYFWGGCLEVKKSPRLKADLYYLGLHEDERTLTQRRLTTLGGRLYKDPRPGELDFEIESTWQFGKTRELDHFAHFQHGELGYILDSVWGAHISVHYDYASGDSDPGDDTFGRFDTLLGARRFELNPTGIYGPFFRSNLHTPGLRIVLSPSRELEVTAFYRAFWMAQAKDAWVGSGLQDPTGESGGFLGNHLEARLRWKPHPYVQTESGYAHFFKGSFLEKAPQSPGGRDSNFFYIEVELRVPLLPR